MSWLLNFRGKTFLKKWYVIKFSKWWYQPHFILVIIINKIDFEIVICKLFNKLTIILLVRLKNSKKVSIKIRMARASHEATVTIGGTIQKMNDVKMTLGNDKHHYWNLF